MKIFTRFLLCLSAFAIISCGEDNPDPTPENPVLQVNPTEVSFGQEGGSTTVNVTSNLDSWTVTAEGEGISVSPSTGSKDGMITITMAPSTSGYDRTGTVSVKSGKTIASVKVSQEAKSTLIVGSGTVVPAVGGEFSINIQYNTDFEVIVADDSKDWIKYLETRAMQSGNIWLSFTENLQDTDRIGKITVRSVDGKSGSFDVVFTQKAKSAIVVGPGTTVPAAGGEFSVNILYNSDFEVIVADDAKDWIKYLETRAMQSGNIWLSFAENLQDTERTGKITVRSVDGKSGSFDVVFTQEAKISCRNILTEIYNTMGGPEWDKTKAVNWGTDKPLSEWGGVTINGYDVISLYFDGFGLKGEFPESLGDLNTLKELFIYNEPGITGSLPSSIGRLRNLETLVVDNTSMTGFPDCFAGLSKLRRVDINNNASMTGPLPESLSSCQKLDWVSLWADAFTGSVPSSWARFGEDSVHYFCVNLNHLTGKIPQSFFEGDRTRTIRLLENILSQEDGYGFDIDDVEIPGDYPWDDLADFDSSTFNFEDVIKANKYTVYLFWAPWCPFSNMLLPKLKDYYNKYHKAGLEIIATVRSAEEVDAMGNIEWTDYEAQAREIEEKGYGEWYNFFFHGANEAALEKTGRGYWSFAATPMAEVYDNDGNVVYSGKKIKDPVRDRYYKEASVDLIPFLETLFGPADRPDVHISTDFSEDGKVMILQKATKGKGIDLVFMADGYGDKDNVPGGVYEKLMKDAMDEYFAVEPYKSFKDYFNVYAVKVVSMNDKAGAGYETALGAMASAESTFYIDQEKAFEYALKVPSIKSRDNLTIGVIVNDEGVGGLTTSIEESQSGIAIIAACGNDPDGFGHLVRHEMGGHGFAFLGDEYDHGSSTKIDEATRKRYQDQMDKYGWWPNIDFTDDPAKVKWSWYLNDSRYKDSVGIFEGGLMGFGKGVYRPSQNSIMNDSYEKSYNAPSREAIYKRIMELSGEGYSFEKFIEYDAVNR